MQPPIDDILPLTFSLFLLLAGAALGWTGRKLRDRHKAQQEEQRLQPLEREVTRLRQCVASLIVDNQSLNQHAVELERQLRRSSQAADPTPPYMDPELSAAVGYPMQSTTLQGS